jgi:hypothetical protein
MYWPKRKLPASTASIRKLKSGPGADQAGIDGISRDDFRG